VPCDGQSPGWVRGQLAVIDMHEAAISEGIIKIINDNLQGNQAKVTKINLKIGKLTAVVPDTLKFCFEALTQGTNLEKAILDIEEIPAKFICQNCKKDFILEEILFSCPYCKDIKIELLTGRELAVESFEID